MYIGATDRGYKQRFREHLYNSTRFPKRLLYKAINEFGRDNFTVELIEECPQEEKDKRERYWINFYQTTKYGYNYAFGGKGNEHIDKMWIMELYEEGISYADIQEITKYNPLTIRRVLLANGISKEELKEQK